jgi:rRNA processing protein Gar1
MQFISTILADEHIFCKFEEKRLMFKKLVKAADYLVRRNNINIKFNERKYLELAEKIGKVHEIRNNIAHNYILPDTDGGGTYYKVKSYGQLLQETEQKKGSFVTKRLNLGQVQKESIEICDEWESLMGEMMEIFANIFSH